MEANSEPCPEPPNGGCAEDFGVPRGGVEGSRRCELCRGAVWGVLPVCWVCRMSPRLPSDGMGPQLGKEETKVAVRPLKKWLDSANGIKQICNHSAKHNTSQARQMERKIKDEFEKLHQFLREEEEARIAALKEEQERKSQTMKEKTEKMKRQISSLSDTAKAVAQQLKLNNITFLQEYKTTMNRVWGAPESPEKVPGALIDVAGHLGNLKYKVWEKMLRTVEYNPVILNPNSADSFLRLSEDLTSVQDGAVDQELPNTPERFSSCAEMLGAQGYNGGRHCWEVEVGGNTGWIVGVAGESVQRKALISACPENSIWAICLRDRKYMALESPSVPLSVRDGGLQRVRVQLDWDGGRVAFWDPTSADPIPLYTFTQPFAERVYPYFCTSCPFHALRIAPEQVLIRVEQTEDCGVLEI